MDQPSRRGVVQGLLVGAAITASGSAAGSSARPSHGAAVAAAPWWLLAPLGPGSGLPRGWSIASLSEVRRGAAVLTLAHPSHGTIEVHLCAHEGQGRGVASTVLVDLILMDGGRGDKATDEALGQVVSALAQRIRANELRKDIDLSTLSSLLPHRQRVARYGPEGL